MNGRNFLFPLICILFFPAISMEPGQNCVQLKRVSSAESIFRKGHPLFAQEQANGDNFTDHLVENDGETQLEVAKSLLHKAGLSKSAKIKRELFKDALEEFKKVDQLEKPYITNKIHAQGAIKILYSMFPDFVFNDRDLTSEAKKFFLEPDIHKKMPKGLIVYKTKKEVTFAQKEETDNVESALEQIYKKYYQEGDFVRSAESSWKTLSVTPKNSGEYKKALNHLYNLADNKVIDAYYYLSTIQEANDNSIDAFLEAEKIRTSTDEKKSNFSKPAQSHALAKLQKLADESNVLAWQAMIIHHCNEAKDALDSQKVKHLDTALAYREKLDKLKVTCAYPDIPSSDSLTVQLASALTHKARNCTSIDTKTIIIQEALQLLNTLDTVDSPAATFVKGKVFECGDNPYRISASINSAITAYCTAFEQGHMPAGQELERLFIYGVEGRPLNVTQRARILNALKKQSAFDSGIVKDLEKKEFQNSVYQKAVDPAQTGDVLYYEGLFSYDCQQTDKALRLLREAASQRNKKADVMFQNFKIITDVEESPQKLFLINTILRLLKHNRDLIYHSFLLDDIYQALQTMINEQHYLPAAFSLLDGLLTDVFKTELAPTQELKKYMTIINQSNCDEGREKLFSAEYLTIIKEFALMDDSLEILLFLAQMGMTNIEASDSAAKVTRYKMPLEILLEALTEKEQDEQKPEYWQQAHDYLKETFKAIQQSPDATAKAKEFNYFDRLLVFSLPRSIKVEVNTPEEREALERLKTQLKCLELLTKVKAIPQEPTVTQKAPETLRKAVELANSLYAQGKFIEFTCHLGGIIGVFKDRQNNNRDISLLESNPIKKLFLNNKLHKLNSDNTHTRKILVAQQWSLTAAYYALLKKDDKYKECLNNAAEAYPVLGNVLLAVEFASGNILDKDKKISDEYVRKAFEQMKQITPAPEQKAWINDAIKKIHSYFAK